MHIYLFTIVNRANIISVCYCFKLLSFIPYQCSMENFHADISNKSNKERIVKSFLFPKPKVEDSKFILFKHLLGRPPLSAVKAFKVEDVFGFALD